MYDKRLNDITVTTTPILDKDYFKCTCKADKTCKNCADWKEYSQLDENRFWEGS